MKFRIPEQTFNIDVDGYFRVKVEALADEVAQAPMSEEVKSDAEVSKEPAPETVAAPQTEATTEGVTVAALTEPEAPAAPEAGVNG